MANPITWRTINSRSNEGAADMMTSAGESLNKGFAGFNKLLEGAQKTQADNRDTQIDNNTQSFLNRLQGIQDPEEMARLQASGELQQMREGFGPMIDQEATRGAIGERLTGLREMQTTNRAYADSETQFGNRDAMAEAQAALAAGNLKKFDEITGNNDFLEPGELAQQRAEAASRIKQEGRADTRWDRGTTEYQQGQQERLTRLDREATRWDRNSTTYEQGQEDRAETKAEETAVDMGTKRLNEIVSNADTPSAARAQTQAWLQSEEAAGIPPAQRNKLQAEAEPLWTQNNGLTENQATQIEETKAAHQAAAQQAIEEKELGVQRIREDNPVDPQYSFTSEDRVDLTQAKKYAEEQVDDFLTKDNIDSALKLVKEERGITDRDDVPWGNLVKMAVDAAKERDVFGDDYDLDSGPMNRELMDVYDRWVETTSNRKNVREAEDDFLNFKQTQSSQVSQAVKERREALKEANKNARALKGGK